jgi:hypothetical protein
MNTELQEYINSQSCSPTVVIPTNVSEFVNDAGYITAADIPTDANSVVEVVNATFNTTTNTPVPTIVGDDNQDTAHVICNNGSAYFKWDGTSWVFVSFINKIGLDSEIQTMSDLINDNFERPTLGAEYTVNGTASFTILNNKLRVTGTGSASSFGNNCINISRTNCENFVTKATFQILNARNSNDYGIGLICQSVCNYFRYSFYMLLDLSTGSNSGKLNVFSSTSANGSSYNNIHVTTRALSLNVNDIIEYKMSRNKNIYTFQATNLNTNEVVSWFMESSVATGFNANQIVNNIVNFGFSKNGTSASNYDILSLDVKRNAIKNRKFLFIGDSITFGYETDLIVNRWADLVFKNTDISGKHHVYAQPGNGCIDYLGNLNELEEFTSEYAIVMLGMNEVQFGASLSTFQTNYTNLINSLVSQGKTPIICLITYSLTNNTKIVEFNNWLKSTYTGTYKVIDTYNSTRDLVSGIHPTFNGNKAIAQEVYNNILDII